MHTKKNLRIIQREYSPKSSQAESVKSIRLGTRRDDKLMRIKKCFVDGTKGADKYAEKRSLKVLCARHANSKRNAAKERCRC